MEKNKYYSATDISKFTYCNYSWYYEYVYGAKHLRELLKQQSPNYNIQEGNFARGLAYHDKFYKKQKIKQLIISILIILSVLLIIYLLNELDLLATILTRVGDLI